MEHITPQKVQLAVKAGFDRLAHYRKARVMYIRALIGQYGREVSGLTGEEPINLFYNVLRATVPNMVMDNPLNEVKTRFTSQKQYAELMSLALDTVERDIEMKDTLRAGIVSAFFGMAVFKVSLRASGLHLHVDDQRIDPGQVYASLVDLDDFVIDPSCKSLRSATFIGHKVTVPRQSLLDNDIYDKEIVKQLPTAGQKKETTVADLTKGNDAEFQQLQDMVNVVELWIPGAESLVTIPDPREFISEKYISIQEYYGPPTGPYEFMYFSPPVPDNPLPIAPASVIYDLHNMVNRVFKKTMDQSDRQRDLLLYNPAVADEARDIEEAKDGDAIACTQPKEVNVVSFGGQNDKNSGMLGQLQVWFNYMAGNPDQLSGQSSNAGSATQASILQSNSTVSVEDAKDIVYTTMGRISQKLAWYLHNDPLIELPMIRRKPGGEDEQVVLTPEQRTGEFVSFTFKIVRRSMNRLDPVIRSRRIVEFVSNIMPAITNTAMLMLQTGHQFNLEKALTRIADELGVGDWVQDLFADPDFEQRMMLMQQMGPQDAGGKNQITTGAIMQNHGYPSSIKVMGGSQMQNQQAQMGANEGQQIVRPQAEGGF